MQMSDPIIMGHMTAVTLATMTTDSRGVCSDYEDRPHD